jgi:hypothetical protein
VASHGSITGRLKPAANSSPKLIMAFKRDVNIGERFSTVSLTSLGAPSSKVFEVTRIRVEGCVVPHAHLVNITNPADQKLISVEALRDRNLYLAVGFRSSGVVETEYLDDE